MTSITELYPALLHRDAQNEPVEINPRQIPDADFSTLPEDTTIHSNTTIGLLMLWRSANGVGVSITFEIAGLNTKPIGEAEIIRWALELGAPELDPPAEMDVFEDTTTCCFALEETNGRLIMKQVREKLLALIDKTFHVLSRIRNEIGFNGITQRPPRIIV